VEHERSLALLLLHIEDEEFGEGPALKRCLPLADKFGDARRHISQLPTPVGFPEPTLAGLLVFRQEFLGPSLLSLACKPLRDVDTGAHPFPSNDGEADRDTHNDEAGGDNTAAEDAEAHA